MRHIYSSPRIENVERLVAVMAEHGIATRVTNRRAYDSKSYRQFSYARPGSSDSWPAVWVKHASDHTRARHSSPVLDPQLVEQRLDPPGGADFLEPQLGMAMQVPPHLAHPGQDPPSLGQQGRGVAGGVGRHGRGSVASRRMALIRIGHV